MAEQSDTRQRNHFDKNSKSLSNTTNIFLQLRQSQNFCSDTECLQELPGPDAGTAPASQGMSFFMMAMMWMLIATVLFLIRPRSLRRSRADDKPGPSSRRDQDDGSQPGPSGSRDDAPGPSVSIKLHLDLIKPIEGTLFFGLQNISFVVAPLICGWSLETLPPSLTKRRYILN